MLISKQIIFTFIISTIAAASITFAIERINNSINYYTPEHQKIINQAYLESGAQECFDSIDQEKVNEAIKHLFDEDQSTSSVNIEARMKIAKYQLLLVIFMIYIFSVILVNVNNKMFNKNT